MDLLEKIICRCVGIVPHPNSRQKLFTIKEILFDMDEPTGYTAA